MNNTTEMYTKYVPIIILRNALEDAQETKDYLKSINDARTIIQEIDKIDLYINQCNESIIFLQENRNKNMRLKNLSVEYEIIK